MPLELIALLTLGVILFVWLADRKAHELAKRLCRRICASAQVELLDDAVSLTRFNIKRNSAGKLTLQRVYVFDYTTHGVNRKTGYIMLTGTSVDYVRIEHNQDAQG